MLENAFVRKTLSKTPPALIKFFYSDWYLAAFALLAYVSWITNQPVIGMLAISLFGSVLFIITADLTPALPLLCMACCIFATDDIAGYMIYLVVLIPLVAAAVFHVIYYPPQPRKGKMFYPQLAITAALIIAGCDCIGRESYAATIGYVLLLGAAILVLYLLYNAYYRKNPYVKNSTYFAKMMMWFGLLLTAQIASYYIKNRLGIDQWNKGWIDLGWGIDNNAATLLLLSAPMCFYLAFTCGGSKLSSKKASFSRFGWLYCLIGFVQYAAICFTFSRGGIVFAVVTAPFVIGFTIAKSRNKLDCIIPCALAVIAIGVFYAVFFEKVNEMFVQMFDKILDSDDHSGWADRDLLYLEAIECFKNHPIFGAGMGYMGVNYEIKAIGFYWFHSTFFQIIGSMGLVGLIAFGYFYFVRYRIVLKRVRTNSFSLFALLSLLGFELYSMIDTGTFIPIPMMATVMFLNLIIERENDEPQSDAQNVIMCEAYVRDEQSDADACRCLAKTSA